MPEQEPPPAQPPPPERRLTPEQAADQLAREQERIERERQANVGRAPEKAQPGAEQEQPPRQPRELRTPTNGPELQEFLQNIQNLPPEERQAFSRRLLRLLEEQGGRRPRERRGGISIHEILANEYAEGKEEGGEEGGRERVRQEVEGILRAIEEDIQDITTNQQGVQQLRGAIDAVFGRTDSEFRSELAELVDARSNLYLGMFTARFVGAEGLANYVTNFQQKHLQRILRLTPGVLRAVEILEEADEYGPGAYWRKPEAIEETIRLYKDLVKKVDDDGNEKTYDQLSNKDKKDANKELWVLARKLGLVDESRKAQEALRQDPTDRKKQTQAEMLKFKNLEKFAPNGNYELLRIALKKIDETLSHTEKSKTPTMVYREIVKEFPELARTYSLGSIDANEKIVDGPNREKFETLIYEINRSFALAERIHHTFAMSASFDGPRWKKDIDESKIPVHLRSINNKPGGLIQLDPIVYWEDPGDEETGEPSTGMKELNVRTASKINPKEVGISEDEKKRREIIKRTYEDLQKKKTHVIGATWTRAWREFYRDNWELIDFEESQGGNSPRELRKTIHYPITLMKPGEANPGKAKFLMRYTYLGVPDLGMHLGFTSAIDIIENWDKNFPKYKPWTKRLAGGHKMRDFFSGAELDLLNNRAVLTNPVEALTKIKAQYKTYGSDHPEDLEEVDRYLEFLTEGILIYDQRDIKDDFPGTRRFDSLDVDNVLIRLKGADVIDLKARRKIANELIGPPLIKILKLHLKLFSWGGSILEFVTQFIKTIVSAK